MNGNSPSDATGSARSRTRPKSIYQPAADDSGIIELPTADVPQRAQPKYLRLRRRVLELIESLPPSTLLPSERELALNYQASRMTVRRALDDLARDGYLTRRQGAGTFTAQPKIFQRLVLTSFTEDMRNRALASSSRLVSSAIRLAGANLGAKLHISPDEKVLVIARLRLAGGEPMAIEWLHVPASLVPGMSGKALVNASFYATLRDRYGIEIAGGSQTIEATVTDEDESRLLGVPIHSPALFVERTTWNSAERKVEFTQSTYRGDRYKFSAELTNHGLVR